MANDRVIYFNGDVEENIALKTIIQLFIFDSESKEEPIIMYLNSPGGNIIDGLAIYDAMNYIDAPVYIVCVGLAASMGSFLLSCGAKGHRAALKHSRILIHQPLIYNNYGARIPESALRREAASIQKDRVQLETILAQNTGQPLEKIHADCERDNWMSAEEALAYGLIDEVL